MNKRFISGLAALAIVFSGAGALPAGTFERLDIIAVAEEGEFSVSFKNDPVVIKVGEETVLELQVNSTDASLIEVFGNIDDWNLSANDSSVLQIEGNGKITGLKSGSTTVTATNPDYVDGDGNTIPVTCTVNVKPVIPTEVASGTCGKEDENEGKNVTWSLDSEGTLTISGEGEMNNYGGNESPWTKNSDIKKVIINDGVTSIGDCAFMTCYCLTSITIPNSVVRIGKYAFSGCSSLVSIDIPNSVTSISESAFVWCFGLESINIPNSVTSIGEGSFYYCSSLASIAIPNSVTSIGGFTFSYCTSLTSVDIPNSVTSINDYAFFTCTSLKSVTIPASVNNIGEKAFGYYEDNYENKKVADFTIKGYTGTAAETYATDNGFTFVSLGVSGTCGKAEDNEGKNVIWTLDEDGTLTISGTGEMGSFPSHTAPWEDSLDKIKKVVIEDGVTSVGEGAFMDCEAITSVTLPDSLKSIDKMAFAVCTELSDINFPDGLTDIGDYAFMNCFKLKEVTVPASVTSIGEMGMGYYHDVENGGEHSIEDFTISGYKNTAAETYAKDNGFTFIDLSIVASGTCGKADENEGKNVTWSLDEDGTLTISGTGDMADYDYNSYPWKDMRNDVKKIVINEGVTRIGYITFYKFKNLESVSLPDTLESIGYDSFSGCESLTSITVPDSVTNIESGVFGFCNNLTSVTLPEKLSHIEAYTFKECTSLASITIPDSVASIGGDAFAGCSGLTGIAIPNGVTTISACAFYGCSGLTEVTIPESVKTIGIQAFYGCTGLTDVTIPEGVTGIDIYAFANCQSLKGVTIPKSVTKIDENAFGYYDVSDNGTYEKLDGFTITGYRNSAAETYATENGFTFIPLDSEIKYGDIDGDGDITDADVALLQQYLADWKVEIDEKAADVNCDGKVDEADIALLQQFRADWNVVLGQKQ